MSKETGDKAAIRDVLVDMYNTLEKLQPYALHINDISVRRVFRGRLRHAKNAIDTALAALRLEEKRIEQMMSDIYWKNKNVLKWSPTLFNRDLSRGKGLREDAINLRWCMLYATELQHLIHWYGFKKEYAERDEKEPWNTTLIDGERKEADA